MPRINNINLDTTVEKNDKFLGSNSGGATKNFQLSDVSKFFKNTNAAGIAGQLTYQYKTSSLSNGNMGVTFSSGSTFQNATSLKVNKYIYGETDSSENLLDIFASSKILIVDIEDQDNYGVYNTTTVTQDSVETDFYDIVISQEKANGSFTNEKFYAIISIGGGSDKHAAFSDYYEVAQATNPWVVTHNLSKFPSVTVVNRNGVEVQAKVTHDSNNQVTITFSGATAGKAYFN
jgi:hypothetical protein